MAFLAAFAAIVVGLIGIFSKGQTYFKGFPVYWWTEYALLFFGLISLLLILKKHKKPATYICQRCERTITFYNYGDGFCPKCKNKLEPLEGFYERHPELKDK